MVFRKNRKIGPGLFCKLIILDFLRKLDIFIYKYTIILQTGGEIMRTVNVRIPEEKRDTLKIISTIEKRDMKEILSELVDEYIERNKETLEILSNPRWVEMIKKGKKEVEKKKK